MLLICFVMRLAMLGVPVKAGGLAFMTVGDWGGAGLGGFTKVNQITVAQQLAATAAVLNASFIISTGDNFYECA